MAAARAPPHPGRVRARSKASDARPGAPWPRMAPASVGRPLHPSPSALRPPGRRAAGAGQRLAYGQLLAYVSRGPGVRQSQPRAAASRAGRQHPD